MNFNDVYQQGKAHSENLLREAENDRLLAKSRHQNGKPNAVLSALGRQMVNLGERLQGSHENENASAVLQPETC